MAANWRRTTTWAAAVAALAVATLAGCGEEHGMYSSKGPAPAAASSPATPVALAVPAPAPLADCTFEPIVANGEQGDGQIRLQKDLSGQSTGSVSTLIVDGKEAAASGRPRDAEAAFMMACRAARGIQGGDRLPIADSMYQLARHYATVAQANAGGKRVEMLQRAGGLYAASLQTYRSRHGEKHERTRFATEGLAGVMAALGPDAATKMVGNGPAPFAPSPLAVPPEAKAPLPPAPAPVVVQAPRPVEAPKPAVVVQAPKPVEAPKPTVVVQAPKPMEAPKPAVVVQAPKPAEAPKPALVVQAPRPTPAPPPAVVAAPAPARAVVVAPRPVEAPKVAMAQPGLEPARPARRTTSPSFDCSKARSTSERLICDDEELARMDRDLGRDYARAKEAAPDRRKFQRDSDAEWQRREDTCTNRECLHRWYSDRRQQLSAAAGTAAPIDRPVPPRRTALPERERDLVAPAIRARVEEPGTPMVLEQAPGTAMGDPQADAPR